ncbi:MAG: AAA family ATPase [Bryobacterales bacterium]|nr:AAA family ATPase [Bryobacterales bacterium]
MSIVLLVASTDEHLREMVRENLLNISGARVASEYAEVSSNLYIRVLQDLERHPDAAIFVDLAGDPEASLKALEKVKQAAPDLYVIAANYAVDVESVVHAVRAGANDFLSLPLRRTEFRDAITRLEKTPRRASTGASRLARIYTFLGAKGGVGTTTMAVNFAASLAQQKQQTVLLDIDWNANDVAMHLGAAPQYTLSEVAENLSRMDQSLFEGFVARDPLGFFFVGPPDNFDHRGYFTEPMFREFSTFLVEKYDSVVIDAGRDVSSEITLTALHSSSAVFLVTTQDYPAIRNSQRYLSFLFRLGFTQDQVRILVNFHQKKTGASLASIEQIQTTLNQPVFYGIPSSPAVLASVNKGRPFVGGGEPAGDLERSFRAFVDKATQRKSDDLKKTA